MRLGPTVAAPVVVLSVSTAKAGESSPAYQNATLQEQRSLLRAARTPDQGCGASGRVQGVEVGTIGKVRGA